MPSRRFLAYFAALVVLIALWRLLLTPPTATTDGEDKLDATYSSWDIVMNDKLAGYEDPSDPGFTALACDNNRTTAVAVLSTAEDDSD